MTGIGSGHTLVMVVKLSIDGPMTIVTPGQTWVRDATRTQAILGWVVEVWHLAKPSDGSGGWLLAGIQQDGVGAGVLGS